PGLANLRRSGLNLPAPVLPPPTAAPQPVFSFDSQRAASGGAFTAPPPPRPSRAGRYLVLTIVAAAVIGGTVYWYQNANKPGQLQITTVPSDAVVAIDNVKVAEHSPASIDKAPGSYTLAVTKDGYVRSEQNVEVRAGQPTSLTVTLEPSPDTGFELTSDPPGGLVWLDGAPLSSPTGQARTDFRASRIPPGHHVVEIKGESRFQPWKQDIEIEAGAIRKIRASLIPIEGGGRVAHAEPKPEPKPEAKPEPKPEPVAEAKPAPEPKPEAKPEPKPEPAVHAGGKKKKGREVAAADEGRPAESSGGDCSITLGSRPWAEVWIDGKTTNRQTPFVDFKVACGKHKITFKRSDLQIDQTEAITVHPGEKFKQSYSLLGDE
ncbi:MAG TPA: PEGA domain-containing protein, partial [Polyangia bacterium]|nr:PEGA domain-containing protein [Polyangia bacterium]